MKTKIILLAALFIGFSISSFSQEQVVIKQVIKNNLGDFTNISTIEINTDCPVMIKSGKEYAVYLVGDIDKTKSNDYKGFCVLKENVLSINSPYKGNKKDLTITIELEESVYNYILGENSKVAIRNNLVYDNSGTFLLQKNAELSVDEMVKLENLNIVAKEDAKIKFSSIKVEELNIDLDKRSILILNGEINTINIKQAEGSHIAGDYKYKNIIGDSDDISDDLVNIVNEPGDSISISDTNSNKKRYETSISWNPNKADLIIGKNANVRIIFSDNIKEGYISNYPIKGYEKNKLIIQDDYPVDLVLTIKKDVGNITLKEGAKVIIDSEIKGKYRSYYLFNNSELIFNNKVEVSELEVSLNNAAKASFKNLKADKLILQGNGTSELEINGEIEILDRYKYDDVNFKGDYKINTTKERKIKELGISTPIPLNINNRNKSGDENSEKIKAQNLGKDKISIGLTFGFGTSNWSNRVYKIDDLFSSPNNEYKLRMGNYWNSWNIGLKFIYSFTPKLKLFAGIGIEDNVFRFENNVKMTETNGDIRLAYETDPLILNSKSNITARYFTIPVHLQYFFYKKFSIHAGGIFGINHRISSTGFERKYDIPNAKITEEWGKNYDNFKPLKFDVKAGIGWSSFNFYVKYSLTPIFKDNKEMVLYPYSIGFSLGI
ncbi:MAG: outer membrane beta-barrel protein [Bacteroidales bacterium]